MTLGLGSNVKWGFQPLNHNKQKCKMLPNDNHDLGSLGVGGVPAERRKKSATTRGPVEKQTTFLGGHVTSLLEKLLTCGRVEIPPTREFLCPSFGLQELYYKLGRAKKTKSRGLRRLPSSPTQKLDTHIYIYIILYIYTYTNASQHQTLTHTTIVKLPARSYHVINYVTPESLTQDLRVSLWKCQQIDYCLNVLLRATLELRAQCADAGTAGRALAATSFSRAGGKRQAHPATQHTHRSQPLQVPFAVAPKKY